MQGPLRLKVVAALVAAATLAALSIVVLSGSAAARTNGGACPTHSVCFYRYDTLGGTPTVFKSSAGRSSIALDKKARGSVNNTFSSRRVRLKDKDEQNVGCVEAGHYKKTLPSGTRYFRIGPTNSSC